MLLLLLLLLLLGLSHRSCVYVVKSRRKKKTEPVLQTKKKKKKKRRKNECRQQIKENKRVSYSCYNRGLVLCCATRVAFYISGFGNTCVAIYQLSCIVKLDIFDVIRSQNVLLIHTYIIGHYNSSFRMLCVLIFYISGGTFSLKSILNDRFLEKLFITFLFILRVFARNLLKRNR